MDVATTSLRTAIASAFAADTEQASPGFWLAYVALSGIMTIVLSVVLFWCRDLIAKEVKKAKARAVLYVMMQGRGGQVSGWQLTARRIGLGSRNQKKMDVELV